MFENFETNQEHLHAALYDLYSAPDEWKVQALSEDVMRGGAAIDPDRHSTLQYSENVTNAPWFVVENRERFLYYN